MQSYSDKSVDYFAHARKEIQPLLPPEFRRVLEVGCGSGATLGWLKQKFPELQTEGIEIVPEAANQARQHVDVVHCLDFENQRAPLDLERFDLILCLDVLEHLVNPWLVGRRLVRDYLVEGGTLIMSLPNVRHHSVLWPLLVRGRWDYANDGVLDRTHLRFFTKQSALSLAMTLGQVELLHATGLEAGRKTRWLNWMTLSLFRPFLEFQYVIRVRKSVVGSQAVDRQGGSNGG